MALEPGVGLAGREADMVAVGLIVAALASVVATAMVVVATAAGQEAVGLAEADRTVAAAVDIGVEAVVVAGHTVMADYN